MNIRHLISPNTQTVTAESSSEMADRLSERQRRGWMPVSVKATEDGYIATVRRVNNLTVRALACPIEPAMVEELSINA